MLLSSNSYRNCKLEGNFLQCLPNYIEFRLRLDRAKIGDNVIVVTLGASVRQLFQFENILLHELLSLWCDYFIFWSGVRFGSGFLKFAHSQLLYFFLC